MSAANIPSNTNGAGGGLGLDVSLDLVKKLNWLIVFRAFFVSILLSSTLLLTIYDQNAFVSSALLFMYTLISASLVVSVLFLSLLKYKVVKDFVAFSYVQIAWDIAFTTGVVYITDGIDSVFSFMYLLNILNAAILLYKRGATIALYGSSIAYTLLCGLQHYGIIANLGVARTAEADSVSVIIKVVTTVSVFFVTGYLSSYVTEAIRRTGEELERRKLDIAKLNKLNQLIVQSLEDGLALFDNNLAVLHGNTRFYEMLALVGGQHMVRGEVQDDQIVSLYSVAFSDKQTEALRSLWEQRATVRWESSFAASAGSGDADDAAADGRQLVFFAQPLTYEEGDCLAMLLIRDMTEYRSLETKVRLSQKLAAVGQLAAGIAHEVRNPLASISGSVQLLQRELSENSEHQRLMDIVLREIQRLDGLISDFLKYARLTPPVLSAINAASILSDAINLFANNAKHGEDIERKVRVRNEVSRDEVVIADAKQISQIIWNMLNNAAEAMTSGGTITVTSRRFQHFLDIVVEDEGPGIPNELAERIFEPFFTTKSRGTGLGLSIAYQIIEAHQGRIFVENRVPRGARFHVLLPRALS